MLCTVGNPMKRLHLLCTVIHLNLFKGDLLCFHLFFVIYIMVECRNEAKVSNNELSNPCEQKIPGFRLLWMQHFLFFFYYMHQAYVRLLWISLYGHPLKAQHSWRPIPLLSYLTVTTWPATSSSTKQNELAGRVTQKEHRESTQFFQMTPLCRLFNYVAYLPVVEAFNQGKINLSELQATVSSYGLHLVCTCVCVCRGKSSLKVPLCYWLQLKVPRDIHLSCSALGLLLQG